MLCAYHSPQLNLLINIDNDTITSIDFIELLPTTIQTDNIAASNVDETGLIAEVYRQLDEYQSGQRQEFTLPYILNGTPFQNQVWGALLSIPFGETVSYSDLAERSGRPRSVRAVANAIGSNPLPVIIPCHRVIGKDGSLTGFGGGLALKRYLLELERG
ncbi:MAG: methylated-DNA--[protein]-cysteine S-methyltransferase [Candidatus Cloacimonetes bacterium]|nr:methylated-DNA--[protein]-cysteine S-methyltransferase [Candidatus Cloacimonadota bacterium]